MCLTMRTTAIGLALAFGCFPLVGATARESVVAIPTPFEIGDSPSGNYLAALIAGAERDTVAASTFFREALRADPKNSELTERAFVAALANGSFPDALALGERLILRDPTNGVANLTLGVQAIKLKQWALARAHLSKGGAARPRDVTATLLTAWTYAGAGDEKKALEVVDRLNDGNFTIFRDYHAALIADVLADSVEATKRFKAVYAAEKNTLRLIDAYARFMDRHGDAAEAKRAYQAFDKLVPNHPLVKAALADLAAGKTLDPLVTSADAGAAEVLYGLGAAGGREGDELASMIYLRLSLYLAPTNALALVTLADFYDRVKQDERAVDVYEMIPQDSPLRVNAEIQIGLTLDALGRTDDGIKQVKGIVADRPKDVDALSALANLYSVQKRYDEAEETFTRAIDVIGTPDASNWALFYRRGITRERQNKWPLAESDFKEALTLFPDQPLVLNYLGYSWVDKGMNLEEGFNMLRRAVDQRPNDGFIVDSLGWAHFRLGQYDEAVKDLERAIDLKPSDPVINDHLGDAYWRVGRKLEAKFQWNHARDAQPEKDDLPRILKKIEDGLPEDKPAEAVVVPKKTGG